MERLGAVILAAGLSSRMGEFKPLLPIGGVSMIRRVV
ncbi:NTP transferase domain-containing protein, partial [Intestinimonas massiliensis]|nr:NTP transferase domain-containing protein [Intestinimonas massiliensis (ex Afouda et al. 2020)]